MHINYLIFIKILHGVTYRKEDKLIMTFQNIP